MQNLIQPLSAAVASWPGVTVAPHRFGGLQFDLGTAEIGHVHSSGMVDIPFNRRIRDQLIAEDRALPHHLLKDTGWITFFIRTPEDVERAIWLFRLSYLFYAGRGAGRDAAGSALDLPAALADLELSEPLRTAFAPHR